MTAVGYPWASELAMKAGGWPADVHVVGKDIARYISFNIITRFLNLFDSDSTPYTFQLSLWLLIFHFLIASCVMHTGL
jgi:hypothetical protein